MKVAAPIIRIAVLGSGSSALACCLSLVEEINRIAHYKVLIDVIDYSTKKHETSSDVRPRDQGSARKLSSWNDASFKLPEKFKTISHLEGSIGGSAAFGGWSNVWGGTLQRYTRWGLNHWGTAGAEMMRGFEFVSKILPSLGSTEETVSDKDKVSRRLPNFLRPSRSVSRTGRSFSLIPSNLAIAKLAETQSQGCNQCGECLTGCPSDHIWAARHSWPLAFQSGHVNFFPNEWIETLVELTNYVIVESVDANEKKIRREYDHVFVGLGALQTGALMLRSKIVRDSVAVRDSRVILIPFVVGLLRKTSSTSSRISLSDAFLISTEEVVGNKVPDFFAQVYGYSDALDAQICHVQPLLRFVPTSLRRFLLRRIGVAMCFLDQDLSGSINLKIDSDGFTTITSEDQLELRKESERIAISNLASLGLRAIKLFKRNVGTGYGYHFGSSFPLCEPSEANQNYSNAHGCPNEMKRIHLVDSSVIPHVTALPITLTVMANSARIAFSVMNEYS